MSRKTSKQIREDKARRNKAIQTEIAIAIKTKHSTTGKIREPAYLYTSLCSDPKRRIAQYAPLHRLNKKSRG